MKPNNPNSHGWPPKGQSQQGNSSNGLPNGQDPYDHQSGSQYSQQTSQAGSSNSGQSYYDASAPRSTYNPGPVNLASFSGQAHQQSTTIISPYSPFNSHYASSSSTAPQAPHLYYSQPVAPPQQNVAPAVQTVNPGLLVQDPNHKYYVKLTAISYTPETARALNDDQAKVRHTDFTGPGSSTLWETWFVWERTSGVRKLPQAPPGYEPEYGVPLPDSSRWKQAYKKIAAGATVPPPTPNGIPSNRYLIKTCDPRQDNCNIFYSPVFKLDGRSDTGEQKLEISQSEHGENRSPTGEERSWAGFPRPNAYHTSWQTLFPGNHQQRLNGSTTPRRLILDSKLPTIWAILGAYYGRFELDKIPPLLNARRQGHPIAQVLRAGPGAAAAHPNGCLIVAEVFLGRGSESLCPDMLSHTDGYLA